MNYKGKKIAITGHTGFIGKALSDALSKQGAEVNLLVGDTRNPDTFDGIDHTYSYLFHFAAPSSQILFVRNPRHYAEVTLKGFMNAQEACLKHGVKLIYPSTGLLSQGKSNEYARCKQICEDMAKGTDALGLRIFACYGPGEGHKRDYASVPYLFVRDLMEGKPPKIFGDGNQSRDVIYIDDAIDTILHLADEYNDPIAEVSSGSPVTFNNIFEYAKEATDSKLEAVYVDAPSNYVEETRGSYSPYFKTTIKEGIKKIVESLR